MTTLAERVRAGALTRGTFLNLGSPLVAEVCALSGFDWLLVDLEHGARGEEVLVGQLLAGAAHDVPMLVRVESAARIRVGHVLDLGAEGVMFPRLETPEEVREALSHLWYPPRGDRGVASYNRARRFGGDTREPSAVNDALLGVVQVESARAVENVRAIAATPGLDVLFVGPADLSTSLGVPGRLDSELFLLALDQVVAAAKHAHVAAGILVSSANRVEWFVDKGFTFIGLGSDSSLLRGAARSASGLDPL